MTDDLCDAVRLGIRYEVRRDFGGEAPETRREYNIRFGQPAGPEADIPLVVGHVWDWFWRLAARRSNSEVGAQPLTFAEIKAWSELTGLEVRDVEVDMLIAMDDAYVSSEQQEKVDQVARRNTKAPKSKAGRFM